MEMKLLQLSALFVALVSMAGCGCSNKEDLPVIHAHRGGAALYPENTIVAMMSSVKHGVPVLELDLHVTRDNQVVVSHDPCLPVDRTLDPNGRKLERKSDMDYRIYAMDYDSLSHFDVGSLPDPRWPRRVNVNCNVPRLADLVDSVETLTTQLGLHPVCYNVEIKSDPSKDSIFTPDYKDFADRCMEVLLSKQIGYRLTVQSFDVRTLKYLRSKYPSLCLSYLVENPEMSFDEQMDSLGFVPQYYSPESSMLTREVVDKAHEMGMKVIPWTVDSRQEALRLKYLGVDALITDCPDSMAVWLRTS